LFKLSISIFHFVCLHQSELLLVAKRKGWSRVFWLWWVGHSWGWFNERKRVFGFFFLTWLTMGGSCGLLVIYGWVVLMCWRR
jgi:hypothetical protein